MGEVVPPVYEEFQGFRDPFAPHGHNDNHNHNFNGKDSSKIEVSYEGWALVKAKPLPDEKPSWSRIRKTKLPGTSKQLEKSCKNHRARTGKGPNATFQDELTTNQQKVVNVVLDERKAKEKDKKAEWVLACIRKDIDKKFWGPYECTQITVILKRQDKKSGKAKGEKSVDEDDIIDIKTKSTKKKKSNETWQNDHGHGGHDMHGGHGSHAANIYEGPAMGGIIEVPQMHNNHDHIPPPPGAIHIDNWQDPHHQNQPHWPSQGGGHQQQPFTPYPPFDDPNLYPPHRVDQLPQDNMYRARSRVRIGDGEDLRRRSSSSHAQRRQIRRVENHVKDIGEQNEHLHDKLDMLFDAMALNGDISSDSSQHTDFWDTRHGGAYSTPGSSPQRSPRLSAGTLVKRRPSHRLLRHGSRADRRYSEAVVTRARRFDDDDDWNRRPPTIHANTFTDYPVDYMDDHGRGRGRDRRREYHPRRASMAGRPYEDEWVMIDDRRGSAWK